jgi:hypothetical protein
VTPFTINSDFCGDLYIPCDSKFPSYVAFTSTLLQSTALLSMLDSYNALLDSGCTHHIIRAPLDASLIHQFRTLPKSLIYPVGQLPTTQNYMAAGCLLTVGHIWCGFWTGKKYSGTRIIIKKISRPFRVHLGAGWDGLQWEPLDDEFYK